MLTVILLFPSYLFGLCQERVEGRQTATQRREWKVARMSLVGVTAEAHVSSGCTWRQDCAALCEVLNQGNAADIQYSSQYSHVTHWFILSCSDWWHKSENRVLYAKTFRLIWVLWEERMRHFPHFVLNNSQLSSLIVLRTTSVWSMVSFQPNICINKNPYVYSNTL